MTLKKNLLGIMLLAGATLFTPGLVQSGFSQVSLGIRIGAPPAPRVMVQPASPGPGYVWVGGYWYPVGGHYRWHAGYYSRPPYEGALWVEPHHDGQQYFAGYWQGPGHERVEHDHHSDRDHDRDYRH